MKKIFLIPILLTSLSINAQKCHYDINKYDDMLKTQRVENTVTVHVGFADNYKMIATVLNGLPYFRIKFRWSDTRAIVVGKTCALIIKFKETDSLLTIYPSSIYSGDFSSTYIPTLHTSMESTLLSADYNISFSDAKMLSENTIIKIRLTDTEHYRDTEIKGNAGKRFKEAAKCVYNPL